MSVLWFYWNSILFWNHFQVNTAADTSIHHDNCWRSSCRTYRFV